MSSDRSSTSQSSQHSAIMASDHLEHERATEPDTVSCNTVDPAATVSSQPEIPNSEASGNDDSSASTDEETWRRNRELLNIKVGKQPVFERDAGGSESNPDKKTVVESAPLKPLKPSNEPPIIIGGMRKKGGDQMSYQATEEATGTPKGPNSDADCGAGCGTCQACFAGCLNACLPWKALDGLGVPDDDDEEALRAFAQWNNSRP